MLHNGKVVGNEQVRIPELRLQVLHQIDDLRLDGNIQCRDRFIANDEFRVERHGTGDADALPLPAGKLMRVPIKILGLQAAILHDLTDVGLVLGFRHDIVRAHGFSDDLANRHTRRKAGIRILENHLHMRTQRAEFFFGKLRKIASLEHNRAAGYVMQA